MPAWIPIVDDALQRRSGPSCLQAGREMLRAAERATSRARLETLAGRPGAAA